MIFGGFQKLTLLDYPGKVACILFTTGCNFRCPFCHNALLVEGGEHEQITEAEVLAFLKKRQGILEGVCITGGEPLLQHGLESFLSEVKALGYSVKLDTNGSYPKKLKQLVKGGLVDYVAMDVKNCFEKYEETAGLPVNTEIIKESISFLLEGSVDYEFRTTVTAELHTVEDITRLSQHIVGVEKYFLQNFKDSGNILGENLNPVSDAVMQKMLKTAQLTVPNTKIRG